MQRSVYAYIELVVPLVGISADDSKGAKREAVERLVETISSRLGNDLDFFMTAEYYEEQQ